MTALVADRVKESTLTTGTASYALNGASLGFRAFSDAFTNGSVVYYCCENGADWEVGEGTYSSGVIARTNVLSSSNANTAVNWPNGNKTIFCALPAESLAYISASSFMSGVLPLTTAGAVRSALGSGSTGDSLFQSGTPGSACTTIEALQHISTIAVLRTINPVASRSIFLNSYATNGDGGHGVFRAATGGSPGTYVDNGGTIIVPNGGDGSSAWIRDHQSGEIKAEWFGVFPDGNDYTTRFQIANDWLYAQGGGTILFGEGTYKWNSVNTYPSIRWVGVGRQQTRLSPVIPPTGNFVNVKARKPGGRSDWWGAHHMTFDGGENYAAPPLYNYHGIYFEPGDPALDPAPNPASGRYRGGDLNNIQVRAFSGHGIMSDSTAVAYNAFNDKGRNEHTWRDVYVQKNCQRGIYLRNAYDCAFDTCWAGDNFSTSVWLDNCISFRWIGGDIWQTLDTNDMRGIYIKNSRRAEFIGVDCNARIQVEGPNGDPTDRDYNYWHDIRFTNVHFDYAQYGTPTVPFDGVVRVNNCYGVYLDNCRITQNDPGGSLPGTTNYAIFIAGFSDVISNNTFIDDTGTTVHQVYTIGRVNDSTKFRGSLVTTAIDYAVTARHTYFDGINDIAIDINRSNSGKVVRFRNAGTETNYIQTDTDSISFRPTTPGAGSALTIGLDSAGSSYQEPLKVGSNYVWETGGVLYTNTTFPTTSTDGHVLLETVAGVTALRGIAPVSGARIHLAYHTAVGDGGHGIFRGVTGAAIGTYVDNGGTVIIPTGGNGSTAWLRDYSGDVNVRWFGAQGNGTNDDTALIQAAIDATYTAGGGTVFIPVGNYKITSSLFMKRYVNLVGPTHEITPASLYPAIAEAVLQGVAIITPTAAVTTAAIRYDFNTLARAVRPYGADLVGIVIDAVAMTSGDGIFIQHTPAGEGPFNTGFASDSCRLDTIVVKDAFRRGVYCQSTATEKVNFRMYRSRIYSSGEHGIYAEYCNDILVEDTFSFENHGSGLYTTSCATGRIIQCDFFNNQVDGAVTYSGNGITDDSYDMRYVGCHIDNNYGHGIQFTSVVNTKIDKATRVIDCRISSNGGNSTIGAYDNVRIGSIAGVGIGKILFLGCRFGGAAHNAVPTARVSYHINLDTAATQYGNVADGCVFGQSDILDASIPLSANFWSQSQIVGCNSNAGNEIAAKAYTFAAWAGASAPNILRGTNYYKTNNAVAASITGFSGGSTNLTPGREIWVEVGDANTTIDFTASNLYGNSGVDYVAVAGALLHCKCLSDGTHWACNVVKP